MRISYEINQQCFDLNDPIWMHSNTFWSRHFWDIDQWIDSVEVSCDSRVWQLYDWSPPITLIMTPPTSLKQCWLLLARWFTVILIWSNFIPTWACHWNHINLTTLLATGQPEPDQGSCDLHFSPTSLTKTKSRSRPVQCIGWPLCSTCAFHSLPSQMTS